MDPARLDESIPRFDDRVTGCHLSLGAAAQVPGSGLAARPAARPDDRHDDVRRRRPLSRASSRTSRRRRRCRCRFPQLLLRGFWYSGTILAILGCHELGHYFACRYYDVDASLPFFLPFPLLHDGHARRLHPHPRADSDQADAVRHRHRRTDRRVSRRRAGARSSASRCRTSSASRRTSSGFELGEPLLFKLATRLLWGTIPDGYSLNMHPMAFAAWFGLLATALNLFPIGQLDGGHISYAVLGRAIDLRHAGARSPSPSSSRFSTAAGSSGPA